MLTTVFFQMFISCVLVEFLLKKLFQFKTLGCVSEVLLLEKKGMHFLFKKFCVFSVLTITVFFQKFISCVLVKSFLKKLFEFKTLGCFRSSPVGKKGMHFLF